MPSPTPSPALSGRVAFVKTRDRVQGVNRALDLLGVSPLSGKLIALKPNLNSADPAPGSTHPQLLDSLVRRLWSLDPRGITLADRSGMGATGRVMQATGVLDLARELDVNTIVLDDLDAHDWLPTEVEGGHWRQGFRFARPFVEADVVVQTCCLKTHRFGGHFTLSLKNSVGMVAKSVPGEGYDYMRELHGSSYQRRMIAEINSAYQPALVVMDGVEAFVGGGPDKGDHVWAEVVLAASDRVALDAVGVAILRHFGTKGTVAQGPIFAQEQIARAVELGLGVDSPARIELLTDDPDSAGYAAQIRDILMAA